MKLKNQILALVIAILIVVNHVPLVYAAKSGKLTINGDIYNAITDVEYGWDGTIYRFADDVLHGVEEGDKVYLVADAATDGSLTVGSNVNVELSNFRLEGENAVDYIAPVISGSMPIQKQIQITKKTIKIAPEHSYIYFGQNKPDKNQITEIANYEEQIINGEDISITAAFLIQNDNYTDDGDYSVALQDQPKISGIDADNYNVILDPDTKFRILTYEPDENAISNEFPDGNYAGVTQAVLKAPEGFQISKNNNPNYDWYDSITIPLAETQSGSYTYYLRNNDSFNMEYYQAISEPKIYNYTTTFDPDANIGESITKNLKAYESNSSEEENRYPTDRAEDTFADTETKEDTPLTIDKRIPDVEITKIDGNYQHYAIKADFTITDFGSGIEKVEYLWDDGFLLNLGDQEYQTDYVEFKEYSSNKSNYELILPWSLSKSVPQNRHTLHLRVTDNAGNVYDDLCSATDPVGSDMLLPNIESIEIRKPQNDESGSILKFFAFGTFYKNTVEIAIKANDNESDEDYYASGVKTVKVNDKIAAKNEEGNEYILVVSPDVIINGMYITVEDGSGLTTKALATEIPEHGKIKSNNLIIENDVPTVDFGNILNHGHKDGKGNIWFGKNDGDIEIKITVADNQGLGQSGLNSVIIKDNGEIIYLDSNFSFKSIEHTETFIIGNLIDGEHIFTVEAEDNCGNTSCDSITFYKDTAPPESGTITVVSPESAVIDAKQWFEKNEVVTFRVDSSDAASGIKNILLRINDEIFNYDYDDIDSDAAGQYVLVDTTGIEVDSEHKYTVTGTVTDFANNTFTLLPQTVYKDFENPIIKKFTVQKKSNILDKVLNVLTFGIYSNDALVFKAYTEDIEFDSGIDYATVQYAGLSAPIPMKDEGDGVFSTVISANEAVFESDIIVVAYDKFGKSSVSCPNISSDEDDTVSNGKFVMIETALPLMTLSLPAGDGIARTDDQVWYNSNKTVMLKVRDENSGISSVDLSVNGVDVPKDKNKVALLKASVTAAAKVRINEEQSYTFDTDYFTSISGEAEDGKYVIAVKITDNAGNVTRYKTTYYVDQYPPVIDEIVFTPQTSDGIENASEFIEKLEYGYFFKTDFNVTVNVSDNIASSGLYEIYYKFVPYQDGIRQAEMSGSQKITDGKVDLNVPKGFKGQILVEVFDYVLNSSGEKTTKAYVVDNTIPDIQITKNINTDYRDADGNKLYVKTNSFTVVITDTASGIKQIGYSQSAEQNPYDRKSIEISNAGYNVDDNLEDGWIVAGVDANLVTQVTKTFIFPDDDNDIILTFDATDNSLNKIRDIKSEKFTVDKTAPIINVVFRDDDDTDEYYNQNRVADITVIERNFDVGLIEVEIKNTFGDVPTYSFAERSNDEHTAVIDFDEGDYTFELTGADLGNHAATVNFSGGNEHLFYVDKTKPAAVENFAEFANSAENSFRVDKTVDIRITEHNFDPELVNLRITRKEAGAAHSAEGFQDVTSEILGGARWSSTGDDHTISFTFDRDAVYYVDMTPSDLAENTADTSSTVIFEIDKTKPVVSMKNGSFVGEDDTEFLDVYPYERKDDAEPTVEFEDLNISYIKYVSTVYIPDYSTSDTVVVKPVVTSGTVDGNTYTLPNFTEDGVYAVELTAVDDAGNESVLNLNTYARMIDQDVLAFIMESNLEKGTGLYSIEYESGEAISKKPSSFDDLKIFVMSQKDTPTDIVLRDGNGKEIITNTQSTMDDSIYGIGIYNYLLKSDFFKDNFDDDTDMELQLTVKNQGSRIDLGKIHIDNIAPECDMPKDLTSWQWFYGETDRTFTISNIDELIEESRCKIYDNGKAVPFVYSGDNNTITFTLAKGWHNVGVILYDMAGNTNNIQEEINIHIGYFWLWVIIVLSVLIIMVGILIVIYNQNKKKRKLEEVCL